MVAELLLIAASWQCANGAPPPCNRVAPPGANSVAVLLFDNVARDTSFAYLADGLASEIATTLAAVPRLEVRSPGMVRSMAQSPDRDPRVLGRRLNVRYVVEGDYQKGGNRIRVSVRLTQVATGTTQWSSAYTRPSGDLLAVQEDVAREVATSIAGQLLPQERTALAAHPTRNPEAWDHFMRGNYFLARRTADGNALALAEYGRAIQLDPGFAQAQARIGLAYAIAIDWGWPSPVSTDSQLALGLAAAGRAIARDSLVADGWAARGYLLGFRYPDDYSRVMPDFERAVALAPRDPETLHQYASKLQELNHNDSAIVMERRALAEDPDRAVSQLIIGKSYMNLRRFDDARRAMDSAIAINPGFYAAVFYRGQMEIDRGDAVSGCRDLSAAAVGSVAGDPWFAGHGAACLAAQGDTAGALAALQADAERLGASGPVPMYQALSIAYAGMRLGRLEQAVAWLQRASPRGAILWSELVAPTFDPLRRDPGFRQFMASIRPVGARDP